MVRPHIRSDLMYGPTSYTIRPHIWFDLIYGPSFHADFQSSSFFLFLETRFGALHEFSSRCEMVLQALPRKLWFLNPCFQLSEMYCGPRCRKLWFSESYTPLILNIFSVETEQFAYSICSIHDEFISLPSTILPFAYHFLLIYPSAIPLIARPAFTVSHACFLRAQRARALRALRALFPLLPSSSFAYLFSDTPYLLLNFKP